MTKPIIIIPCGAKKRNGTYPAKELYTGVYFRACLKWALSIIEPENIYILSAKYGILALNDIIATYDIRMGEYNSIKLADIYKQVIDKNLINKKCIAIGGKNYTNICKQIWQDCITPLAGKGGLGHQISWLNNNQGKYIIS